ncbi:hypothetical protein RIU76_06705 [Latilactobacillus sakei subsp. sakei]|uniref:hypothetical protein n=1 Tax=Latilactobacillus TaxID=2767885 RepID=UPI000DBB7002|nr:MULTISPECIES: hypothetical protein [Latilactobacillus]MDG2984342.1 DNA replication initiation control protein YabA [Latilactobacillus curvatus]MDR7924414.1 hypothetical protein [Latilactobacillus sakei subsp. sakei]WBY48569.1 hypothetical protein PGA57_07925 [Latilactobacillus curvatus]BBE26733.1 hypothetical protein NFHkm12_15590 [Latilactobacillus curvatus]
MGYSDIKEAFDDARDFATGANNLQLKRILLEIQSMVYDLQEENRELRIENHDLRNKEIVKSKLYMEGPMWRCEGDDYKYCPKCYGESEKLIPCNFTEAMIGQGYSCPVCKSFFTI